MGLELFTEHVLEASKHSKTTHLHRLLNGLTALLCCFAFASSLHDMSHEVSSVAASAENQEYERANKFVASIASGDGSVFAWLNVGPLHKQVGYTVNMLHLLTFPESANSGNSSSSYA